LAASLSVAVPIAAYLAYLYGCFPNRLRRTVFKRALRKLAGLSKADMEQALTLVHHALNSLNGQPLFSNRLERILPAQPAVSANKCPIALVLQLLQSLLFF